MPLRHTATRRTDALVYSAGPGRSSRGTTPALRRGACSVRCSAARRRAGLDSDSLPAASSRPAYGGEPRQVIVQIDVADAARVHTRFGDALRASLPSDGHVRRVFVFRRRLPSTSRSAWTTRCLGRGCCRHGQPTTVSQPDGFLLREVAPAQPGRPEHRLQQPRRYDFRTSTRETPASACPIRPGRLRSAANGRPEAGDASISTAPGQLERRFARATGRNARPNSRQQR